MNRNTLIVVGVLVAGVVLYLVIGRKSKTTTAPAVQFTGPPYIPQQQSQPLNTQRPVAQPTSGGLFASLSAAAASIGNSALNAGVNSAKNYFA